METKNNKAEESVAAVTAERFMEEARAIAALAWNGENTRKIQMIPELAEEFAGILALWMRDNAQAHGNVVYYQGLLDRVGRALGEGAHTCDDGSRSESVLRAKVPELVEQMVVINEGMRFREGLLRAQRNRVWEALAGLVGVREVRDIEAMEKVMRGMPGPDEESRGVMLAALAVLKEVRP